MTTTIHERITSIAPVIQREIAPEATYEGTVYKTTIDNISLEFQTDSYSHNIRLEDNKIKIAYYLDVYYDAYSGSERQWRLQTKEVKVSDTKRVSVINETGPWDSHIEKIFDQVSAWVSQHPTPEEHAAMKRKEDLEAAAAAFPEHFKEQAFVLAGDPTSSEKALAFQRDVLARMLDVEELPESDDDLLVGVDPALLQPKDKKGWMKSLVRAR